MAGSAVWAAVANGPATPNVLLAVDNTIRATSAPAEVGAASFGQRHTDSLHNQHFTLAEQAIARAVPQIDEALSDELLARITEIPSSFFEKLVLDVIVAMAHGGTLKDAATVVGQTGDGGIDGVIRDDELDLDMIYVQAKRWDNVVGPTSRAGVRS